ncbi:MAG TPA: DUF6788 family protein [Methylomirabilota bacterium]|nr:DUF6788 family protein [Methylomirabilota bacterium]
MPTASRKKRTAAAPAPLEAVLQPLQARHRALLRQRADLDLVLRGTITKCLLPCGKPACRCKADPPILHGPYYLWTRKVAGKTVTVRLTAEQAARCQPWTRNMHTLDRLVRALQAVGLRAAAAAVRFP